MSNIPAHLQGAQTPVASDQMDTVRAKARQYALLELEVQDLETRLEASKEALKDMRHREIPELFASIGTDKLGVSDIGEFGADVKITPYYFANIQADWDRDRKEAAFANLDEAGHGDVIKCTVSVEFSKSEFEEAKNLAEFIRTQWPGANNHSPVLNMAVPWNTLTRVVREEHEASRESGEPMPLDLEKLGATIGRVAKITMRKK